MTEDIIQIIEYSFLVVVLVIFSFEIWAKNQTIAHQMVEIEIKDKRIYALEHPTVILNNVGNVSIQQQ
jgi:hypothetical protein